MKKYLWLVLAFLVALSPCSSVWAEEDTLDGANPSAVIPVTGDYVPGSQADKIISVKISWGSMDFQYTDASEGTWNPSTHQYEGRTEAAWTCGEGENEISVTNHSNTAVDVSFSFDAAQGSNIVGEFNNDTLQLATAENTAVENAPSAQTLFDISSGSIQADGSLGTITVTIDPNAKSENTQEPSGSLEAPAGDSIDITIFTEELDSLGGIDTMKTALFYDAQGNQIGSGIRFKSGDTVRVPQGATSMIIEYTIVLPDAGPMTVQCYEPVSIPSSSCTATVNSGSNIAIS